MTSNESMPAASQCFARTPCPAQRTSGQSRCVAIAVDDVFVIMRMPNGVDNDAPTKRLRSRGSVGNIFGHRPSSGRIDACDDSNDGEGSVD